MDDVLKTLAPSKPSALSHPLLAVNCNTPPAVGVTKTAGRQVENASLLSENARLATLNQELTRTIAAMQADKGEGEGNE